MSRENRVTLVMETSDRRGDKGNNWGAQLDRLD